MGPSIIWLRAQQQLKRFTNLAGVSQRAYGTTYPVGEHVRDEAAAKSIASDTSPILGPQIEGERIVHPVAWQPFSTCYAAVAHPLSNRYEAVLTDPGQGGNSNVWRYLVIERRGEPLLHFHKIRILEVLSDLGVRLGVRS